MDVLTQLDPQQLTADTFVLPAVCPIPGLGLLPMNSFLIRGTQPMLVDAGPGPLAAQLIASLERLVELDDLAWIWLTHTDPDHLGALGELLVRAPRARVVTTFLALGKLGLATAATQLPMDRVHLIAPGDTLDIGDRELVALRPPVFDAPETMGLFDGRTRTLFPVDCFGALADRALEDGAELSDAELADGMTRWTTIDAPWVGAVPRAIMNRRFDALRRLQPAHVASSHLPPVRSGLEALYQRLVSACDVVAANEGALANAA